VLVPPASFCEEGMHPLDPDGAAVEVDAASAYVAAATRVFEDRKGRQLETPIWVVQVGFFGVRGTVLGRLDSDDPEVRAGMGVEVVPATGVGPEHVRFRPKEV